MTYESFFPVEALKGGEPFFFTGGDYELPDVPGWVWVLTAVTGSVTLKENLDDV